MSGILIRLPWPSKRTSPNAKGQGKWRAKSQAAKAYKETCQKACWEQKIKRVPFKSAEVHITIYMPDKRKRDLDNVLASIKQGLDAIAEATGVDDSDWLVLALYRGGTVIKGGQIAVYMKDFETPEIHNIEHRGLVS